MKKRFKNINLGDEALAIIKTADAIIQDYQQQGLRLTLRQLYYQFVSKDLIANTEKSYKRLGKIISDGRLAGLLDWAAIEDRARQPEVPNSFENLADLAEAALRSYKLDRWRDQANYVELWVEKDALAGVLAPIAVKHHVTLMVNRGYSSQSAMYESARRFIAHPDHNAVLLYLGDHDPSGEDMVRDVEERLSMFGVEDLHVEKLALTMDQIEHYAPPPNPTKLSDSRAAAYVEKFGHESWEVDALNPRTLTGIIERAIKRFCDTEEMARVIAREENDKRKLRELTAGL
jgi:hypothetical protein